MSESHSHAHGDGQFNRAFAVGVGLNLAFVGIEAWYGWSTDSLSLLADAGHNLSDVAGLVLAWGAMFVSRLKPDFRHTYGWSRAGILAAFINAVLLLVAMGSLCLEAFQRLHSPEPVQGKIIMAVATIGIVINGLTALLFMKGRHEDLNLQGAFVHMAADALVSVGVVVAGAMSLYLGWDWIDPVVSIGIAIVIVLGSIGLLKKSVHLLFDAVPENVDLISVQEFLQCQDGVMQVLDLHIWAMSTTKVAMTAHLLMREGSIGDSFLSETSKQLHARFGIDHLTLQLMNAPVGLTCDH